MSDADSLRGLFAQWPQTAHLGATLRTVDVEMSGRVVPCVEAGSLANALDAFIAIADGLGRAAPREMRLTANKARGMVASLRAFDADPLTVMRSGVN